MPIRSKLFYFYVAFVLLYIGSFLAPRPIGSAERYDLSTLQYRLLSLTVFIPIVLIWYAAFYGCYKLRRYTALIRNTPDGRHVAHLTTGLLFLAFGLPLSSLISSGSNILIQHYPDFATAGTVIRAYSGLIFPLIGFSFISLGARGLSELAKQRPGYRMVNALTAAFIAIGVTYCYIMITSDSLQTIYHMPVWLVLATIVCPYLYMWYLGMLAAYELHLYSRKAPGVLYRKTWNMLALGIGAIISMQIAVQYVSTITAQFSELRLVRLLVIVYVLLVSLSVGYVLVAIGAKRLQKIEEV